MRWHNRIVYFPTRSAVAESISWSGTWEPEITAALLQCVHDGDVVFDVGANIGASAIPLLTFHPSVNVISFEASPSVLPYLLRTRQNSPDHARWHVVPKAVTADANQTISFTRFERPGDDVYEGVKNTGRADGGTIVEVPTTTVDAEWLGRGRPNISLIKIDVEGAELDVLRGAIECVRACCPTIVTEWCVRNFRAYGLTAATILDFASQIDYDVYLFPELSLISNRRLFEIQLATRENLLLLPRTRKQR